MNELDINKLNAYNTFCKNLREGCILYNVDNTNSWGDYFLVANISAVRLNNHKTYSVLLMGLKKDGDTFLPRNNKIKLTPEFADNLPFLKYIGRCHFTLRPELTDVDINLGLASMYGSTDVHKYAKKLSVRKPKKRRYGSDGKPIIKKTN